MSVSNNKNLRMFVIFFKDVQSSIATLITFCRLTEAPEAPDRPDVQNLYGAIGQRPEYVEGCQEGVGAPILSQSLGNPRLWWESLQCYIQCQ